MDGELDEIGGDWMKGGMGLFGMFLGVRWLG